MREDGSEWFAGWKDELVPLSQTHSSLSLDTRSSGQPTLPSSQANSSAESAAHSADLGSGVEHARTPYRRRVVWTLQLHERFLEAVAHLENERAVPKRIMEFMNVEGLTRENVASHLQKYRHQLKIERERRELFASFPVGKGKPSPSPLPSKEWPY